MRISPEIVACDLNHLWSRLFLGPWAELIIPVVIQQGEQFIGCVIPIEHLSFSELRQYGELLARNPENEVTLIEKQQGRCLSVVSRPQSEHHYDPAQVTQAAVNLRDDIRRIFRIPVLTYRVIDAQVAKSRLY